MNVKENQCECREKVSFLPLFPKELHALRTSPGGLVGAMQGLPSCESSPPHFLYFYFVV